METFLLIKRFCYIFLAMAMAVVSARKKRGRLPKSSTQVPTSFNSIVLHFFRLRTLRNITLFTLRNLIYIFSIILA